MTTTGVVSVTSVAGCVVDGGNLGENVEVGGGASGGGAVAVTNLSNQPQLIQPGPPSLPQPIFEFTKRKRWADLLVTQLSEAILLMLSPQMNVLYCGSAVWALLGWQDHECVDKCLLEFMNCTSSLCCVLSI